MSLDIGEAFSEGVSRTFGRNGLLLAAAFAVVAVVTVVLSQTLTVGLLETMLETFRGIPPEELNADQQEYEQLLADLEAQRRMVRESSPLALDVPASVAAAGLLVTALVAEAVSIVAVRVFATDETESVSEDLLADGILLATLNGFVGGIVVWGLIAIGSALLLLPGIFLAVVFYFLRQEIALKNKNFVQAMADSWRLTKGHRIEVFALGIVVVVVSQLDLLAGSLVGFASNIAGEIVSALLGGLLAVFGAAVVTRAYLQLDDENPEVGEEAREDPYDAALGPDDIPE